MLGRITGKVNHNKVSKEGDNKMKAEIKALLVHFNLTAVSKKRET